jgi:sugar phosphate isomerase/epimerase
MVKIGVAQWCLDCKGVNAVLRAADLRFSAIQIDAGGADGAPFLDSEKTQDKYLQAVQDTGVEILAIGVNILNDYGLKNSVDSKASKEIWHFIKMSIDAAAKMGIGLVFLPSFDKNEIQDKHDLIRTITLLNNTCLYASDYQVMIATENTLGVEDNQRLLKAVNHPRLKILIDTLNPVLWGHCPSDLIKKLWPYMCNQIHVKDGINGIMGNASLGKGDANFLETARTLQNLGFSGYIILENEYSNDAESRANDDMNVINRLFDRCI